MCDVCVTIVASACARGAMDSVETVITRRVRPIAVAHALAGSLNTGAVARTCLRTDTAGTDSRAIRLVIAREAYATAITVRAVAANTVTRARCSRRQVGGACFAAVDGGKPSIARARRLELVANAVKEAGTIQPRTAALAVFAAVAAETNAGSVSCRSIKAQAVATADGCQLR